MNQRFLSTGMIFVTIMVFWLSPHRMFGSGDPFLALAQAGSPVPEPYLHYQEQLSNHKTESKQSKFWRKHRSYPHKDKALRLIKEDKFSEALEVYDEYLKADPNHDLMRWYRLILLSQTANSRKVIDSSTDFLNRVPDFGPAMMIRAFAYNKINAFDEAEKDFESALLYKQLLAQDRKKILSQLYSLAVRRNNFIRSADIARQLIDTYPEDAKFREYYAQSLYQLKNFPGSEKQWENVQRLSKDNATVRRAALSRMTILVLIGRYGSGDQILKDVQDQNLFNPSDVSALDYLNYLRLKATLSGKRGRPEMSKTSFEEALSFLNDSRSAMHNDAVTKEYQSIGDAAYDTELLPLALKVYTHALEVGNDPQIRLKASEIAWQLKNYRRTTGLLHPLIFNAKGSAPISPKIAERLCMAYGKQGRDREASDCFDKLIPIYSQNLDLLAKAAHAAGRTGKVQHQVDLLRRSYHLKPSSGTALNIGYLYSEMEQQKSANNWFQIAYQKAPTVETGMAYANGLLAGRNVDNAVSVIEEVIQFDSLSPEQRESTYSTLATAYMKQNDIDKAIDTWHKAHEVSSDMAWNIHRVTALRKTGRLKMAEVLFSTISVDLLPPEAKLTWYDEAGELYKETGRFEEGIEALRQAADMNSTYQRQLGLSMLLLKMNRLPEAEASVNQALIHRPDDLVAQRHKAYVLAAKGDNLRASRYMEKIYEILPEDYEALHSLGLLYMKLGRYGASTQAFRGVIDATQLSGDSGAVVPSNRLKDLKAAQNQLVELNRRFRYSLSQSVNVGETDDRTYGVHLNDNGFTTGYGSLEVAYRPPFFGYGSGRSHEIYSNILWTQDDSSVSEDYASIQGRLGLRSKPFASTNLVISAESVFPFDSDADPNVLLRVAHSFSKKPWHLGHEENPWLGPNFYLHTYTELGKAFLDDAEYFGNLQTRIGRSFEMSGRFFLSPFAYLLANGFRNEDTGDAHWQVGIGTAFDHFSGYDRYKGYRRHSEVVVRIGLDLDRDARDRELNGLVGLRFSFF